jgi:quinoprotein glucose dehydrogenase
VTTTASRESAVSTTRTGKSRLWAILAIIALLALGLWLVFRSGAFGPKPVIAYDGPVAGWEAWGGDPGGSRYSPLTQITPQNVSALKPAWTYHVGAIDAPKASSPTFEATPITAEGRLYVCNGGDRVAALDPETGREIWAFDPKADKTSTYLLNCRGVTYYHDAAASPGAPCAGRIFGGTLDGRMVALDSATGRLCPGFGQGGILNLASGLGKVQPGDLAISSPPVIAGDLIVVGGRIPDNMRTDVPAGVVRAFDARTGALAWSWNPLPPGVTDAQLAPKGETYARATPNAWAPLSVDPKLGLVFVPTGNAAPDHFGGNRHGLDYYASSVVALDMATGAVRWRFQTVHHDVWDYDVPAQPVLFDLPTAGGAVPALAQATKQGNIFILDRRDGRPLYPVEERTAPQAGAVPGETLSPTQPFPANPAFVVRAPELTEDSMWGFTPFDRAKCRELFRSVNYQGLFTPPSTRGTIQFPSFMGASNWGGVSIDPQRQILIANTTQVAAIMTLIPRQEADRRLKAGEKILPSFGSPYANTMKPMLSPFGAPCNRPPWGTLTAIDLAHGKRLWEVPFGTTRDRAPPPLWLKLGTPNIGGSVVTASGLAFIGASTDNYLRAYDVRTGKELWRARLPAGGQATPMTYRLSKNGRQYVVIAAGGHKYLGTKVGDTLTAYALPK